MAYTSRYWYGSSYRQNTSRSVLTPGKRGLRQGFTLVEILIVVAIIAVLAGIIGGNFITSRVRARDADRKSSLGQIRHALELYYNDHGTYPEAIGGRVLGVTWGQPFCTNSAGEAPVGNSCSGSYSVIYMAQLPIDGHSPDNDYLYETNTAKTKYRLYARLENEEDPDTDLDGDGEAGDSYDGTAGIGDGDAKNCGDGVGNSPSRCNYGISSPSTRMEEVWTD